MPENSLFTERMDINGEQLRQWRTTRHLRQADIAHMLDVPVNTIARWERGEMQIAQPRVLGLALQAISFSLSVSAVIRVD